MSLAQNDAVGDFFIHGGAGTKEEVSESGLLASRIGIAEIIPANPVVDEDGPVCLPGVLGEKSSCAAGGVPVPLDVLSADRVVSHAAFGVGQVLHQVGHAVKAEGGQIVRPLELFHV